MDDCLSAGTYLNWVNLTNYQVNSAFYPPWDGKMSISFLAKIIIINGGGKYSHHSCLQADWLAPKVGSHLVLFYSHRMNRVNAYVTISIYIITYYYWHTECNQNRNNSPQITMIRSCITVIQALMSLKVCWLKSKFLSRANGPSSFTARHFWNTSQ